MKTGEGYSVKIEKIIYGGFGLGRIENEPVFIENAVPEDILKIRIKKINKSYLEGEIIEIEKPSKYRITPECSFAKICGSCDLMHIQYDEQLKQKQQMIKEALKKIANIDKNIDGIIPSPKQKNYRCKIQLPYSITKVSKRLLSGYYKKNSHELINMKYCPMQADIINEINEFLKNEAQKLEIDAYNERKHTGLIRHVIYRISSDLSQILIIIVINSNIIDKKLEQLSRILVNKYHQITGICANFNIKKTNVITSGQIKIIYGNDYYEENLGNKKFKISALSFFQVNPYCAELIFDRVKELIVQRVKNPSILDAYSGVSSFGIWLSDIAKEVICIEEAQSSSKDAIENVKINGIKNIKIINGDAAKEFEKLIKSGKKFDISITDPPRKGCSIDALENLIKLTSKYIIYVSCNPATLARDIKYLTEKGFNLEYIQGADMFVNTYHVESIALLKNIEINNIVTQQNYLAQ